MTTWKEADEAPEGWQFVSTGAITDWPGFSTWLDSGGILVLVPVQYEECRQCCGSGVWDDEGDEEGADCPWCGGSGREEDEPLFQFNHARPKGQALKLRDLHKTDTGNSVFDPSWVIRLEVVPDTLIKDAIAEALAIIYHLPVARVEFEFSGVPVIVTRASNAEMVEAQWWKDTFDFNARADTQS